LVRTVTEGDRGGWRECGVGCAQKTNPAATKKRSQIGQRGMSEVISGRKTWDSRGRVPIGQRTKIGEQQILIKSKPEEGRMGRKELRD